MGNLFSYFIIGAIAFSIVGFFVLIKVFIFGLILGNRRIVTNANYVQEYLSQDTKLNTHIPVPFHVWAEAGNYQVKLLEEAKKNALHLAVEEQCEASLIEFNEKEVELRKQKRERQIEFEEDDE